MPTQSAAQQLEHHPASPEPTDSAAPAAGRELEFFYIATVAAVNYCRTFD
jgi:hypothetical protein